MNPVPAQSPPLWLETLPALHGCRTYNKSQKIQTVPSRSRWRRMPCDNRYCSTSTDSPMWPESSAFINRHTLVNLLCLVVNRRNVTKKRELTINKRRLFARGAPTNAHLNKSHAGSKYRDLSKGSASQSRETRVAPAVRPMTLSGTQKLLLYYLLVMIS